MPAAREPLTAEFYTSRGLDLVTAQRFAAEHNTNARLRAPDAAPAPPPVAAPTRLPQLVPSPTSNTPPSDAALVKAEKAQLLADYMAGKIDSRTYTDSIMRVDGVLPEIARQRGLTRSDRQARHNEEQIDTAQAAIEESLDAAPPARTPWEYTLPGSARMNDEEAALDKAFREGLHSMGTPRELGNHMRESITAMAQELLTAQGDVAVANAIIEREEQRLRGRWGAQFDANVAAVRALLRDVGLRSPQLRGLIENHPELYSSADTMSYMLQLVQRQQRALARGGT
jgi:hypothetical protein